ncbi:MAG: hypothetical protein ACTHLD_12055, partial [Chitinophaga sp.]
MSDARVRYLVTRFFEGSITTVEKEELAAWVEQAEDDDTLKNALEEAWNNYEPDTTLREQAGPALNRIIGNLFLQEEKPRFRYIKRIAVAAAVALIAGTGIYYWYKPSAQPAATAHIVNDVPPGGAKAVLTLSNGQQIVL